MQTLNMAHLGAQLGIDQELFITRENGESAYPLILERLQSVSENEALSIVFPPHQLMDSSFADESIVRIGLELLEGRLGHRGLLLQELTVNSIINLNSVLAFHTENVGFLATESTGEWQCLGKIGDKLLEALNVLAVRKQITAPELAEVLDIEVNTASNRLKRLYGFHLTWREHEISELGLQYIYHFWEWTA